MPPKAKPNKKDKEREERERLEKEREDARREEEERLKRELEAAQAAEAERLRQEKLLRLPPKFHFRVCQVGWKVGNPPARYGHISLNVNGLLFVFSGSAGGNSLGYFFDLASKQWTEQTLTGDAPGSNMRASVVQHNSFIYYYGGYGLKGMSTDLYRLDTISFAWECLQYTGTPPCHYGMSAVLHDNSMVLFGGRSPEEFLSNDTYVLDLHSLTWHQLTTTGTPPSKRYGHNAVIYKEVMYVYGGLDAIGTTEPTAAREDGNSFHCLDLGTCEWTLKSFKGRGPGPGNTIHGETCSMFKNGILVALGYQNERVYILNLDEGRWHCCTLTGDLMGPRMYHSAVVFLGRSTVALFGGQNRKMNQEFNDTFLMQLITDEEET